MATDVSGGNDRDRPLAAARPYLIGPENALLRVLLSAGTSQPPMYNPIIVYGPAGVGKSHVLQGVVDRATVLLRQGKPWTTTGIDFARHYARAVELDSVVEVRERWQSARLVVIDGLDDLATRLSAQQELLHLVDDCLERECQLLCACRAAPLEWSWMLPGLRSRLESGLTIPIALPAVDTRVAIVTQFAGAFGLELSAAEIHQLASRSSAQPGTWATYSQLRSAILSLAHTGRATGEQAAGERSGTGRYDIERNRESVRRIARLVARQFELKLPELLGTSRRKTVVQARGVAIYLARSLLGVSFDQLGRNFGNRDHTTILHAFRRIDASRQQDPVLKQTIDRLWQELATTPP
jgi:chromosomal replication initiator protein